MRVSVCRSAGRSAVIAALLELSPTNEMLWCVCVDLKTCLEYEEKESLPVGKRLRFGNTLFASRRRRRESPGILLLGLPLVLTVFKFSDTNFPH